MTDSGSNERSARLPQGATPRSEQATLGLTPTAGGRAPDAGPAGVAGAQGMLGDTGEHSAQWLLENLRAIRHSGTLALADGKGTTLLLLARGQVESSFKLGPYARLDAPEQRFHLHTHEPSVTPQLPPRFPTSQSPFLRALPRLAPPQRLTPGAIDLPDLLERLHESGFDGSLSYATERERSVALLVGGSVRAAVHEVGGVVHDRAEAMRALQKAGQARAKGLLELDALEPAVVLPLAALALGRSAPSDGAAFTGLEVFGAGFRFYKQGQPFLEVMAPTEGPTRRYALAEQAVERAPQLELPDEPPGWEDRRFALTLRGRDALNPMTALHMTFRSEHGPDGQRLLEALGKGDTLGRTADALGLELGDMRPWLERLERAGMLREVAGR